ncbi:MAG: tetratricopeptide repeat protein [Cephaloticoccus sp.]|nr:tetratricopeptide repeat protein [Cephaloticoccus sp.]MCF7760466.1 tetratricopeptide repeat protein [Cephaloticoccus sp.]
MKARNLMAMAATLGLLGGPLVAQPGPTQLPGTQLEKIVPADAYETSLLAMPIEPESLAKYVQILMARSETTENGAEAQKLRLHAREIGLVAQAYGSGDLLLNLTLAQISREGRLIAITYHDDKAINHLLHLAETKFAQGDFEGALAAYTQAASRDPKSYHAALSAGNLLLAKSDYEQALLWLDRAVANNPDGEAAHRYRGDVLMQLKRPAEAGASYIQAYIASPFAPVPSAALEDWARLQDINVERPDTRFLRGNLTVTKGKLIRGYDPAGPAGQLSLVYLTARSTYYLATQRAIPAYRQSLEEEAAALRKILQDWRGLKAGSPDAQAFAPYAENLALMADFDRKGWLEAFILLDRSTDQLMQDYSAYRRENRDLLFNYIKSVWLQNAL